MSAAHSIPIGLEGVGERELVVVPPLLVGKHKQGDPLIMAGKVAERSVLLISGSISAMPYFGPDLRTACQMGAAMTCLKEAFSRIQGMEAVFVNRDGKSLEFIAVVSGPGEAEEQAVRSYEEILYKFLDVEFDFSVFYRESFPELEPPQGMQVLFKKA